VGGWGLRIGCEWRGGRVGLGGGRVVVWWKGEGKYTTSFVEICHTVHT